MMKTGVSPICISGKWQWLWLTAIFFLVCTLSEGNAQPDSTTRLPTVTIRDTQFDQTGYRSRKPDTLPVACVGSLADRLSWENAVNIRPNAPGTLATASMRGMGPNHTPVFWNGLNLQSPMNGTVDLSLLPVWPNDRVELRYGGQSANLSSGVMGGSILVETGDVLPPGWSGAMGIIGGSFGDKGILAETGWGDARLQSSLRGRWETAVNDFSFHNTTLAGQPLQYQSNNRFKKWDLQQSNRFVLGPRSVLKTAFWSQGAFREIPPLMTAAPNATWQKDAATRAVLTWEFSPGARSSLKTRMAWLQESIYFHLPGSDDSSHSSTALLRSEYTVALSRRLVLRTGANAQMLKARSSGYSDGAGWFRQNRTSAWTGAEWTGSRLQLSAMARQEWASGQAAPFTWSLGGLWDIRKAGAFRFHVSRNFNLPTFNDRFWKSLGNPDLLPERGYSADAGWSVQGKWWTAEATVFRALIDNWILWQPGQDGLFRPGNLKKVQSEGLESALSAKAKAGNWNLRFQLTYQRTSAINTAVYSASQSAFRKQLTYVPKNTGSCSVRVEKGNFSGVYLHQLTGLRYATTDNGLSVPGYQTGTFLARYRIGIWKQLTIDFDFRIENCWNASWQYFIFQPMPGRSWHAGFMIRV
jgi:iron complex outermembrane receptor protein